MDTSKQERFAGRFTEWEPLGEGAEGRLYRVRDRWTGRMAALKVASGKTGADSLLTEFDLLSRLRHPCLIESTDLVRDGEETAHLLEYVPAVDPRRLWEEGGEEAVWSALIQALRGLAYLHRHGFVHGDVAPGNILVWKEGDRWRAKVADLGMTRPVAAAAKAGIGGTPGFLSPEVARGEGARVESDLFSLAATAVAWIDGRGPWEGMSPARQLKQLVDVPEVPRPRRRISAPLEALLRSLGGGAPESRGVRDWSELRDLEAWGPPVLAGTIVGVRSKVREWNEWLNQLPEGGGACLTLGGLAGTGKKTVARAMARHLVARGWLTLSDVPMDAMQDWLDQGGDAPDPVALSQALSRRFAGHDVIILVTTPPRELEARLLQAFLASRSDSRVRTVVWITQDSIALPMPPSTRQREEEWKLSAGALDQIYEDLYAPEEFDPEARPGIAADTPLALLVRKKIDSLGGEMPREVEGLGEEIERLWSGIPVEVREALAVLAVSEGEWFVDDLAAMLGWDEGRRDAVLGTLNRIGLSQRTFGRRGIRESLPDWLIKATIAGYAGVLSPETLQQIAGILEAGSARTRDLGFLRFLDARGIEVATYAQKTLDQALRQGKFEAALGVREPERTYPPPLLERFLKAAGVLGRYRDEVSLIHQLLDGATGAKRVSLERSLAVALGNLGRWSECIEASERVRASSDRKDQLWAALQIAECLWQSGDFAGSDEAYETIQKDLRDEDDAEWLRYAVGRARQSGQRGRVDDAERYLELAVSNAGADACQKSPFYLSTRGAFLIESGEYSEAEDMMQAALPVARDQRSWNAYAMISHKASSAAYGLGNMAESIRLAQEGVSASIVLGSDRITAMLSSMIGYPETMTLRFESALDRARGIERVAESLSDKNLKIQGLRLRAFVSAYGGLGKEFDAAAKEIMALAGSIGEGESQGFVDHCRGIYFLGQEEYEPAIQWLETALEQMSSLGHQAIAIKIRILLVVASFRAGSAGNSKEELGRLLLAIKNGKSPSMEPLISLAMAETASSSVEVDSVLERLWASQRYLDIVDWLPGVAAELERATAIKWKQRIVSVIQRAAGSIDDAGIRTEFLRRGSTSRALKFAMG